MTAATPWGLFLCCLLLRVDEGRGLAGPWFGAAHGEDGAHGVAVRSSHGYKHAIADTALGSVCKEKNKSFIPI